MLPAASSQGVMGGGGGVSGAHSLQLLTLLRPTDQHCFATLPTGSFLQQRQTRDPNASGCLILLLEWTDSTTSAATPGGGGSAPAAGAIERRVYVGWQGEYLSGTEGAPTGDAMGSIGLPALFAQALSIPSGLRVRVTMVGDVFLPRGGPMVVLEPVSSDDWEILELNPGQVEMGLLAQVQVLNPGQVFPFWLAGGTRINLKYTPAAAGQGSKAAPFAKLALNSEVSIVPKPRPSKRAPPPEPLLGSPPPIARLRVQPRQAVLVAEELAAQRRAAEASVLLAKDAQREARWKEWEEKHAASSGFDMSRSLIPAPAFTQAGPPVPSPTCSLASPHYVHVSPATMRFLAAKPDDLVVLTCATARRMHAGPGPSAPNASRPAMQQPPHETLTTVLRIAPAACVFEGADAIEADGNSYLSSSGRYILLPPALRLSFGIGDFAWVHVQRLTAHSAVAQSASASPLKQALCVRESLQRLQNIRLKEIEVRVSRAGLPLPPRASAPPPTRLTGPRAQQAAEEDARLVSDAFIAYVRSSLTSAQEGSAGASVEALAVPFINGGVVDLQVPVHPSSVAHPPHARRRFFSVHFNEADLLAAQSITKRGALALATAAGAAAPASLLDMSPPSAALVEQAAGDAQGGLRVSMATSYLLVRAPPADVSGAKKKGAPPALPLPVLHVHKQPVDLVLDRFEEEWTDQLGDSSCASTAPVPAVAAPEAPLTLAELGASPEHLRTVVRPLVRFLRSTLCAPHIRARSRALRAGATFGEEDAKVLEHVAAPAPGGGLMLVGGAGIGKSALVWAMCEALRLRPSSSDPAGEVGVLAQTQWLDCKLHLGTKTSELLGLLGHMLAAALAQAPGPSIIVFEDLDRLLPASTGENDANGLRATQLAEGMLDLVSSFQARHPHAPLALLSIAASTSSHHPLCNLLFPRVVEMAAPSAADRVAIVGALASRMGVRWSRGIDLSTMVAKRTEGYLAADLKQLVQRAAHAAVARTLCCSQQHAAANHAPDVSTALVPISTALVASTASLVPAAAAAAASPSSASSPPLTIESSDLASAFRGFVPSSLKDLGAGAVSGEGEEESSGWCSIGGMFEAKATLLDTFELPVRYAELFARAPIKLRSGLLLYGPSGCGKTLLASHIAAKCGLNFVPVKGPELLNKYIGSSEANVRDVFARARAAAPALLFFDEMDSIVPARGSESTGVTDRVVNQFLCELDGVEGKLAGASKPLYVLGASSRPDLIDPALLRPGRLDKAVYCGLPSRAERLDMLRCMTRKLQLEPDVDLAHVAEHTEEYTPADLQAIVTNAQLALVQEVIAAAQEEINASKAQGLSSASPAPLALPPLSNQQLLAAFAESKPSTSAADRAKFDRIYRKFRVSKEEAAKQPKGPNDFDPTKKQRQVQA